MSFPYTLRPDLEIHRGRIKRDLWEHLRPERQAKLGSVIEKKRRDVLCLFENTHHCHNISAVLRSIEAMGFLEACFVYHNTSMQFRTRDSVERGASQWLLTKRAADTRLTGGALRAAGYKILAVSLPDFASFSRGTEAQASLRHFDSESLLTEDFQEWRADSPLTLVFGSELAGVSPEWLAEAHGTVGVRMSGFVESLNMSVCAGMLLHTLRQCRGAAQGYHLSESETELTLEYWLSRSVKNARRILLAKSPELEDYFDFIRAGRHFDPFPEAKRQQL